MILSLLFAATLVDYLNERTDLAPAEKAQWEKALKLTFGGSALRDGDTEAIGAARAVIAFGMFNRLEPAKVIAAAYEAKNDALAYVPPPMAIKYQQLVLVGRKPKETARFLAFNFPRYFDEELAPEMVAYWQMLLDTGKVNSLDLPRVKRQLEETREKMRPSLRETAKRAAETERDLASGALTQKDVGDALDLARKDLVLALGEQGKRPFLTLFRELGGSELSPPREPPPPPPPPSKTTPKASTDWQKLPPAIKKWLGTPYLLGGIDEKGIDCSGFSREVYRDARERVLPRTSGQQYLEGRAVERGELKEGDLVFFDTLERGRITHVAVYKGGGIIAHATSSRGVIEERLDSKWLARAYRGSRRVL